MSSFPVPPPTEPSAAEADATAPLPGGPAAPSAPPAPEGLPRGANLGRYVVLEKLGQGGMGVVYAAYDQELDRKVALKLLTVSPSSEGARSLGHARLVREAQALAQLSHPNVVAVHDVLTLEGRVVMVMEFVDGSTVKEWLKTPRSRPEVFRVFLAAGEGLAAAHHKGLVHRDFKPDNVLVGRDGRIRVADFGIARQADAASPDAAGAAGAPLRDLPEPRSAAGTDRYATLTLAGEVIGTLAYMAPEQLTGGAADARSDQFSFAVTLYEALAGVRPYPGTTLAERGRNILEGKLTPPLPGRAIPGWVLKVLLRAMSSNPAARYTDMPELLTALRDDPAVGRRRMALGAAMLAVLALSGAAWAIRAQAKRAKCEATANEVNAVWSDAARGAVRQAFLATRAPYAAQAFNLVEGTLGPYVQAWRTMARASCLATTVQHEQSVAIEELRRDCLTDRREGLSALTEVLRGADAQVLAHLSSGLAMLSPVRDCADISSLLAQVRPPTDAGLRRRVAEARPKLLKSRMLLAAGKPKEGLPLAQQALSEAGGLGFPPLQARARLAVGLTQEGLNDFKAAAETLFAALAQAESLGDDKVVMEASLHLGSTYSRAAQPELSRKFLELALSVAARTGGAPAVEAYAHLVLGNLEDEPSRALVLYRKALRMAEQRLGPEHPVTFTARSGVSYGLSNSGQHREALLEDERSVETIERILGPGHPSASYPLNGIGVELSAEGRFEEGAAALRRALRIEQDAAGDTLQTSFLEQDLADIDERRGALHEALDHARRGYEVANRISGPDFYETLILRAVVLELRFDLGERGASLRQEMDALRAKATPEASGNVVSAVDSVLAHILLRSGQPARALEATQKGLAANDKVRTGPSIEQASLLLDLGREQLALGRATDALATFQKASGLAEQAGSDRTPEAYEGMTGQGEAYLALGQPEAARKVLAKSVAFWPTLPLRTEALEEAQAALARAVP